MDVNTDSVEKQLDTSINLSKESVTEEILLCPSCKKQLNKGTKFCVFCGTKIEEKIPCPNCGKLIPKSSKFCNYCGEGMKEG
jgi:RNA polymerase subunit RPABC4/transcription elongation factor Spt4